jgi:hypothetical protein
MTPNDPWELLADALPCIDRSAAGCRTTKTLRPVTPGECNCVACDIDAALADRNIPIHDWVADGFGFCIDVGDLEVFVHPCDGGWQYRIFPRKIFPTQAEAKSAAIAAAKGLR